MIPLILINKFGKPVSILIIFVIGFILTASLYFAAQQYFTAQPIAQAKINKAQNTASQASGFDAVNTVGNSMKSENIIDLTTKGNSDDIEKAQGSDVAVHPDVRSAGLRALCKRSSYRINHSECLQYTPTQ